MERELRLYLIEAELLGTLAKDKEHGVDNVGFAAAVGPHHRRKSLQTRAVYQMLSGATHVQSADLETTESDHRRRCAATADRGTRTDSPLRCAPERFKQLHPVSYAQHCLPQAVHLLAASHRAQNTPAPAAKMTNTRTGNAAVHMHHCAAACTHLVEGTNLLYACIRLEVLECHVCDDQTRLRRGARGAIGRRHPAGTAVARTPACSEPETCRLVEGAPDKTPTRRVGI